MTAAPLIVPDAARGLARGTSTLAHHLTQNGSALRRRRVHPEVVHVTAECWPFARSGGLGEAVATLAAAQARTGARPVVVMPLYRSVRSTAGRLAPVGPRFSVCFGSRSETVRLFCSSAGSNGVRVFFAEHDGFFDRPGLYGENGSDYSDNALRFACLARAALEAIPLIAPSADVVHAHDWHASLVPMLLRTGLDRDPRFSRLSVVLSVHNAAFQGHFPRRVLGDLGLLATQFDWGTAEWYGELNLLKGGVALADAAVAVSPTYSHELQTPEGGFGLHETFRALGNRLCGVVNGIDTELWDPASDTEIVARFSAADLTGKGSCKAALQRAYGLPVAAGVPLVGMCARLTEQKGFDLVLAALEHVENTQFIIVGEGEARFADGLARLAARRRDRFAVDLTFRDATEHHLLAGADCVLLPSRYEPCGLTQMRAQRYGAVPIARRVGGLADTIRNELTGFLFDDYSVEALLSAVRRALDVYANRPRWKRIVRAAMRQDFGWQRSVARYRDVYRGAMERRRSVRQSLAGSTQDG